MPSSSDNLYCVLTFKHLKVPLDIDFAALCQPLLSCMAPLRAYLLILETGKTGTNEHLNLVLKLCRPRRTDHVRKIIYNKVYKQLDPEYEPTKHDVKVKTITNENMLIGGYLQKESSFKVLLNTGYDLDEYKRECKIIPDRNKLRSYFTLTPHNAIEQITAYASENELPLDCNSDVRGCLCDMAHNRYNLLPIMGHLNKIRVLLLNDRTSDSPLISYIDRAFDAQHSRETAGF